MTARFFNIAAIAPGLVAVALICGCQPRPGDKPLFGRKRHVTTAPTTQLSETDTDSKNNPFLPLIQPQKLTIWQITVPYGSVSSNGAFWKYVDENALNVATYDMLYKNGLRVGQVDAHDWEALRRALSSVHATSQQHQYTGADAQTVEIPVRSSVVSESLFYFDAASHLAGRTFDLCDNILAVSFEPASLRPRSATRVTIHPMVRSRRQEIEFTKLNNSTQVQYVYPQHLYDLSLRTDIPRDRFFVVAPSPEARTETSLGHAFLTRDDLAEQTETVLLILPTGFESPKSRP